MDEQALHCDIATLCAELQDCAGVCCVAALILLLLLFSVCRSIRLGRMRRKRESSGEIVQCLRSLLENMTGSKGRMKRQASHQRSQSSANAGNSNARRSQTSRPAKEGWLCLRADCRAAQKKIINYGTNLVCFDCQRDKCSAMNPPSASIVPWAAKQSSRPPNEHSEGSTKDPKKPPSSAPAQEPEKKASAKPQVNVDEAETEQRKPRWTKMCLSAEELASISSIAASVPDIISSMSNERIPSVAEDMVDASAVFTKLTDSLAPCASLTKQAELDNEVRSLQAALLSLDVQRDAAIVGPIQDRLNAAKEQRNKVTKKTPTDAALVSALKEARVSYERTISDRLDRLAVGASRAAERKQTRRQGIQKLRDELNTLEAMLEAKENEAAEAFSKLNASQASVEATVLSLFDAKLLKTQSAPDATMQDAENPQMVQVAAGAPTSTLSIRTAAAAVETQLQEAQQELQKTLATLEAQKACIAAENAFNAFVDVSNIVLPKIELEGEADTVAATLWLHFLDHWTTSGGIEHFSISMVESHLTETGYTTMDFLAKLLGDSVWTRWLPLQPKESAVFPRQLAQMAHTALRKLQTECAEQAQREAIRQAAGSSFAKVTAQNKKRRAGI